MAALKVMIVDDDPQNVKRVYKLSIKNDNNRYSREPEIIESIDAFDDLINNSRKFPSFKDRVNNIDIILLDYLHQGSGSTWEPVLERIKKINDDRIKKSRVTIKTILWCQS